MMRLNWLSRRSDKRPDPRETERADRNVDEAKAEAVEALAESYGQLERVRELNRQHEPVRKKLRPIRERNGFAEGLMRVIEEGGR